MSERPWTAKRLCGEYPRRAAGPLPWQSCARSAEECCGAGVEQESSMEIFGFFDVLVLAIGGHFLVKIITTWLKTREGVTKRHMQQLEQRLRTLETQQVADLHKRLSVLEEVFVLDDVAVQRKLGQALGDDPRAPASPS